MTGGTSDEAASASGRPTSDVPPSDVLVAMEERLQATARPFRDPTRKIETLIAEATPFVESARRAATEGPLEHSPSWREARSFAWLLAYRLGDQGWPAHVTAAVVPAWRDAVGTVNWSAAADELQTLVVEGYARGREDRARTDAQRGLATALPVAELAPQVVLIVAAGALDPDGASALADRASAFLLRKDARAALLDIGGLVTPTGAVLAELWAIASAARMLGVRMVVSGVTGLVAESVRAANLHDEGELRIASLAQAVDAVLNAPAASGWTQWLKRLVERRG